MRGEGLLGLKFWGMGPTPHVLIKIEFFRPKNDKKHGNLYKGDTTKLSKIYLVSKKDVIRFLVKTVFEERGSRPRSSWQPLGPVWHSVALFNKLDIFGNMVGGCLPVWRSGTLDLPYVLWYDTKIVMHLLVHYFQQFLADHFSMK
jgi:hypothetical protein